MWLCVLVSLFVSYVSDSVCVNCLSLCLSASVCVSLCANLRVCMCIGCLCAAQTVCYSVWVYVCMCVRVCVCADSETSEDVKLIMAEIVMQAVNEKYQAQLPPRAYRDFCVQPNNALGPSIPDTVGHVAAPSGSAESTDTIAIKPIELSEATILQLQAAL